MARYAQQTDVPPERSRAEIERTLQRYGATAFLYGWAGNTALIGFEMGGRRYRISLPLPDKRNREIIFTPDRQIMRTPAAQLVALEKATRQRWRAMALWVKALLEAQEAGIITLQEALQSYLLLPDGRTVGEWLGPQVDQIYQAGRVPMLLPGATDNNDYLN